MNDTGSDMTHNVLKIVKGSIISIVISLILLIIFALILTYSNIPENTIAPIIIVIAAISILAGSSLSTLKIKKNGILNGGIIGLVYICILYLLSSLVQGDFGFSMYSIIMIVACILAGMLGGIIGVNVK